MINVKKKKTLFQLFFEDEHTETVTHSRKEGKGGRGPLPVAGPGAAGSWWGYWPGRWSLAGVGGPLSDRGHLAGARPG